jgi:hypothetical protein
MKYPITLESLDSPKLYTYNIKNDNYNSQLKKVHNSLVFYINSTIENTRKDDSITEAAALLEGESEYDGQKHLILHIINQVGYLTQLESAARPKKMRNDLKNLIELINNLAANKNIPEGMIGQILEFIDAAFNKIPTKQSSATTNMIKLARTKRSPTSKPKLLVLA